MTATPDFAGSRYDPRPGDEARLDSAIARRNTAWAHYEAAASMLKAARKAEHPHLRDFVRNYNQTQHEWEWAVRDLVIERRRFNVEHQLIAAAS